LGVLSHPHRHPAIYEWMERLRGGGVRLRVSKVADYEVRRELLRAERSRSIRRLDALGEVLGFEPISRPVLLRAATLWAEIRRQGRPTAADPALDADVIIAAQAQLIAEDGDSVVVATSNVRHFAHLADAREWQSIS
jgi:predicted nucleic acid-binding protein